MKSSGKRNGTLELMRFVFCMSVLLFHVGKNVMGGFSLKDGVHLDLFPHGAMGVEFFFLLSGLFLARSVDKECQKPKEARVGVAKGTLQYVWKKYASIFPQHFVAFVVLFIVTVFIGHLGARGALTRLIDALPGFLMVQMTGWGGAPLNHVEWYLSVMFIAMLFLYPLCRANFKVVTRFVAPLAAAGLLIWMWCEFPSLTGVTRPMLFTYKGVVRGFAEMLLGTFIYSLTTYGLTPLADRIGTPVRVLLTVAEWLMYGAAMVIIVLTLPYAWEYLALAVIFVGVMLSYSGLTLSGKALDNGVSYFLGKLSLPIYLSQLTALSLTSYLLPDANDALRVVAAIGLTAVSSAITMLAGNGIAALAGKIGKK